MRIVGGIVGGEFQACAAKPFRMMVARDGVEPPTPAFSGLDTFIVNCLIPLTRLPVLTTF
jgi:hypothetical protein